MWDGELIPLGRTQEILEKNQALFDENRFGIWGVRGHGSAPLVGFAGLWEFHTPLTLELLFGVAPGRWNRGLATEASRGVVCYGFESAGLLAIEGSCDIGNAASIRVMEKLGLMFQRREVLAGLDTVFYRLTRGAWEDTG